MASGNFLITIMSRFIGAGHVAAQKANEGLQMSANQVRMAWLKVAGAAAAGWALGTKIAEWTGLRKAIDAAIVPVQLIAHSIADIVKQRTDGLTASFEASRKELERMEAASDRVVASLGALDRSWKAQVDLEVTQKVAAVEREMPPGPEREERIARIRAEGGIESAKNAQSVAQSTLNERQAAAARNQAALDAAFQELLTAKDTAAHYDELIKEASAAGRPALQEDLIARREADARAAAVQKHIDELAKGQQTADTAVKAAQADLTAAIAARADAERQPALLAEAETKRRTDEEKQVSDARKALQDALLTDAQRLDRITAPANLTPAPATPEAPANLTPAQKVEWYNEQREAIALRDKVAQQERQKAAKTQQDASDRARAIAAQAQEQAQFADQAAAAAEMARERVIDPKTARAADRADARAKRDKARDDKHISNLLKRAREAGYEAIQGPGGMVDAVKKGNVGPISKRLADAVVADAKAKFAEQQKAEAARLDREAKEAAKKSVELLDQIRKNTEAGPVV